MNGNLTEFLKKIKLNLSLDENDLNIGFNLYSAYIESEFDRLSIFLHLIMVQTCFISNNSQDFINITKENIHTKLTYDKVEPIQSNKTLQLKSNIILVLLKTSNTKAVVSLKHEKYLSPFLVLEIKTDKLDIRQVVNDFKSKVINPLKYAFKNQKLINGLTDLPIELQFKLVLNYLDIESFTRLIQTSRYFYDLFNSTPSNSRESVWFHLFKRDWDKHGSLKKEWVTTNSGIDFRNDYIKKYKSKIRKDYLFHNSRLFRNY